MSRGFLDEDAPDGEAREIEIACTVMAVSDDALKLDTGDRFGHWLPRSQVSPKGLREGWSGTVTMPQWLARKKGII